MERRDAEAEVARIAAKGLVAADARQGDLDVTRGRLGHDVRGNRGRVRERLVEPPDDLRQDRLHVGLQDLLVVLGREAARHEPRIRQLVVRGRRELRDPHMPGVERRHQPLDRSALSGGVPALEQHAQRRTELVVRELAAEQ